MKKTILQIPLDQELKDKATKAAVEMGFSSLQESVRILIKQIADKTLHVQFIAPQPAEFLSDKNAKKVKQLYQQVIKERKNKQTISSTNTDDLMAYLDHDDH